MDAAGSLCRLFHGGQQRAAQPTPTPAARVQVRASAAGNGSEAMDCPMHSVDYGAHGLHTAHGHAPSSPTALMSPHFTPMREGMRDGAHEFMVPGDHQSGTVTLAQPHGEPSPDFIKTLAAGLVPHLVRSAATDWDAYKALGAAVAHVRRTLGGSSWREVKINRALDDLFIHKDLHPYQDWSKRYERVARCFEEDEDRDYYNQRSSPPRPPVMKVAHTRHQQLAESAETFHQSRASLLEDLHQRAATEKQAEHWFDERKLARPQSIAVQHVQP